QCNIKKYFTINQSVENGNGRKMEISAKQICESGNIENWQCQQNENGNVGKVVYVRIMIVRNILSGSGLCQKSGCRKKNVVKKLLSESYVDEKIYVVGEYVSGMVIRKFLRSLTGLQAHNHFIR
ncbi:7621_t:CDS:2, partial [Cetraspora pellucida]